MEPYCAVCDETVPPDDDHVHVEATSKNIADRDEQESYYFHPRCWMEVTEEWTEPA
jgi:hypothetical protein